MRRCRQYRVTLILTSLHEKRNSGTHERRITTSNSCDSLEQEACITPRARVCREECVSRDDIYLRRPPIWNRSNPRISRMHNRALFIIRDSSQVEMLIGSFLLRIRIRTERAISIYVKSIESVFPRKINILCRTRNMLDALIGHPIKHLEIVSIFRKSLSNLSYRLLLPVTRSLL